MRILMIREIGIKTYRYSYRYYEYMVEVDQIQRFSHTFAIRLFCDEFSRC